jgi:hypothetical protein
MTPVSNRTLPAALLPGLVVIADDGKNGFRIKKVIDADLSHLSRTRRQTARLGSAPGWKNYRRGAQAADVQAKEAGPASWTRRAQRSRPTPSNSKANPFAHLSRFRGDPSDHFSFAIISWCSLNNRGHKGEACPTKSQAGSPMAAYSMSPLAACRAKSIISADRKFPKSFLKRSSFELFAGTGACTL